MRALAIALLALAGIAGAQPITDTSGEAKRLTGGSTLPATCNVRDVYFLTTGTIGGYECRVKNIWTLTSGEFPLTFSAPIIRTVNAISLPVATSSQNGYLSSTDWSTFNLKVSSITCGAGMSGGVITSAGTCANIINVNAQTGTSYTIVTSDYAKLVTYNNAAAVAVTLPQIGSGGNFLGGWYFEQKNLGAGTVTITPTTSTVDGVASVTLTTGQSLKLVSDGASNYIVLSGKGSGGVDATVIKSGNYFLTSGTSSAYTGSPATAPSALATGQIFYVTFHTPSTTTTPTLNINSLGAKTLVHEGDSSALASGEVGTGNYCKLYYDGTNLQISGPCLTGPGTITLNGNTSPVAPVAGKGSITFDTTLKVARSEASDGTLASTVKDLTCAGGNFFNGITAGLPACGTPAGGGSPIASTLLWPFGPVAYNASTTSPATGGANTTQFYEVLIPSPGIVITNISAYTASVTIGHAAFAIYDSTCTLLATSATVNASTGTATNWTIGSTSLAGGKYFIAFQADTATAKFFGSANSYVSDLDNLNEGAGNLHTFTGTAGSGTTTLVFPGTCGTRTALSISGGTTGYPAIGLH